MIFASEALKVTSSAILVQLLFVPYLTPSTKMGSSWAKQQFSGYSKNRANRYTASQEAQLKAEEIARDILGDIYMRVQTVQIILQIQAPLMDPLEWLPIKHVLDLDEASHNDLARLCWLLSLGAGTA
ncbi:hypothetical protein DL95DRAFT_488088 [Leptodontidium sp. 2 PMI_412]|nr:hypothetical protein BKA61DRAFT_675352 [Leptodontidium sp. MPI-SDFR-AT-0119]KAH9218872.1 hypothetical protein DL95DRAFT_488088 [Leptodontidium sp. 2 PMI_412]